MKLWHDDIRKPPDDTWTWARTNEAAMELLAENEVSEASLDHDLGHHDADPDAPGAHLLRGNARETGQDLAEWMVWSGNCPEVVRIHSWNPVGARRMGQILEARATVIIEPYVA